ncbi:MAG: type VII toxin-antitoxin system HepT family RNase toxin [Anaerolineales bacterium]|jgi:uncharacterized protein YutE (UPF0331/DUF86 family)
MDTEKITNKLMQIDEFLELLNQIGSTKEDQFVNDKILIGSAKYYLQVSIEACLDVANHIIASERLRAPKDYADSFSVLNETGFISTELCRKLRQMAKFRNRLVHLYSEIDNNYIYGFIRNDLNDFLLFKKAITKRLKG